jgi:hypothetical protein
MDRGLRACGLDAILNRLQLRNKAGSSQTETPSTTATGVAGVGSPAPASASAQPKPPGHSSIVDTSSSLTRYQRTFAQTLTEYTEKVVGNKLALETGLKIKGQRSAAAKKLSEVVQAGEKASPITKAELLKAPKITDPNAAVASDGLSVWKPDYLLIGPNKLEVFEVTADARFQITPQEKGMSFSGRALPDGWPHKLEQLSKAEYLLKRYPEMDLIYNIQTFDRVPPQTLSRVNEIAAYLSGVRKRMGATGRCEIIIRAEQITVISVP